VKGNRVSLGDGGRNEERRERALPNFGVAVNL
jgi:hypothetical protein